ncbi:integrin-linked protein kinase 1-like isoform X1 [Cynara cardunculus var. scolymus]|uniref:integrin-linked protein kinase 1-like isoform X1 n=1 Tax=Cynara cardunculus var. scolymus TaxID=59895 RepID=UPI000D629129|nr:integrin-linked protein kinase 1-like isoform X1 [Cynara cardunculus var. scolymus]
MESVPPIRFTLGRQSSMAPDRGSGSDSEDEEIDGLDAIDPRVRLMFFSSEGNLDGIKELLDSGTDVNFKDIDNRTALHVAACQGFCDVAELLLEGGAEVDPKDRWGSTPLADAIHYKNYDMIKLLEKHGAKPLMAPMHVKNAREVPEYEIAAEELDFTDSVDITKGTFTIASWRGTKVAVKKLGDELFTDKDKVRAFRDELELLQKIRHPNVVQFLGAVTQSSPMMIVTEYLPKGDLRPYLKRKGALKPFTAVKYAMDIARGMNYLHENKPEPIIHRDLEPSNILRADSGHLKVADFGISELVKVTEKVKKEKLMSYSDTTWRYVAPEVFRNEDYDTKVDVFSFALILQEMIEGCQPFFMMSEDEVPKAYVANQRPPFNAPSKCYAHGLKELIEECWHENPEERPTFRKIITRLESTYYSINRRRRWKVRPLRWFQKMEMMWKKEDSERSSRDRSSHI